jgi:hypothetical protein
MRAPWAALLLVAAAGGCRFTVGHLGSVTPTAVAGSPAAVAAARVAGRDCVPIFGVAPTRLPSLDRAAREALAGVGGTTLSDVVIRYELRYIPFVYGRSCYVIEGAPS